MSNEAVPTKKKVNIYLTLALMIGIVFSVVMSLTTDGEKLLINIQKVSIWIVLISLITYLSANFIDGIRLYIVARSTGYRPGFWFCILNGVVGGFFAHVTPLAMGGQPFQIYHLSKHGMKSQEATNIIFSRFVVNAMILMSILLIGFPVVMRVAERSNAGIFFFIGLMITVLFAFFLLIVLIRPHLLLAIIRPLSRSKLGLLIGKLSKKVDWAIQSELWVIALRREVHALWGQSRLTMILDAVLNVFTIIVPVFAVWFPLYMIVGDKVDFFTVLVTYIAIWQVVMYLPTPGASGGLEGMLVIVFTALLTEGLALDDAQNVNASIIVAIVVWRFSTYYLSLIPGAIFSAIAMKTTGKQIPRIP